MSYLSYTHNFDGNLLMLLLRSHERYMPIVEFFETMTQNLSELSWSEAELIATEISKVNGSKFCSGIRDGVSHALKADSDALGKRKLASALTFALKLNERPAGIEQEDINRVLDGGWSEQTVEDIVGLVAIQNLYNIIASGLGFEGLPEAAFAEIGADTVAKGGYIASFQRHVNNLRQ